MADSNSSNNGGKVLILGGGTLSELVVDQLLLKRNDISSSNITAFIRNSARAEHFKSKGISKSVNGDVIT